MGTGGAAGQNIRKLRHFSQVVSENVFSVANFSEICEMNGALAGYELGVPPFERECGSLWKCKELDVPWGLILVDLNGLSPQKSETGVTF